MKKQEKSSGELNGGKQFVKYSGKVMVIRMLKSMKKSIGTIKRTNQKGRIQLLK